MLNYSLRRRRIKVVRAPTQSAPQSEHIATIDLKRFTVQIMDEATPEEIKEVQSAVEELRTASPEKKAATFGYAEVSKGAVEYYLTKATDLDKQLILATARGAFKTIRRSMPPNPQAAPAEQPEQAAAKSQAPVTPEMLAEALYQALAATAPPSKYKLQGPPRSGRQTEIRGFWNLNEVAKSLLSRT